MNDDNLKSKIITILNNCKGKDKAILSDHIARIFDIDDDPRTNYQTRKLIREIIDEGELPIGSCRNGYFLIVSQKELCDCIDSLESRAASIRLRKNNIQTAFWKGRRPVQEPMF